MLVLGDEEDVPNDEAEVQAQSTKRQSRGPKLPHVGVREALALMILAGALLIGAGVYGVSTGESASLLWLISGFPFLGGRSGDDDDEHDGAEHARSDGGTSLSEVENTEAHETSDDIPAESSVATRTRPEISVANADGEREVDTLVKTLMRHGEQLPLPDASGIVAPIRRPLAATLEGIPQELTVLRRDVGPVLVGITYNMKTVDRLSSVYDTMLVVAPHHEDALPEVLKYLPALIQTNGVSGLGSARTFTIPAPEPPGPEAASQATLKDLRGHKGEPLHPLARTEPDFLTVSAPAEWTGPARSVLSDYAPVIDIIEWDKNQIHVAGFVFDSAIELPDHIVSPDDTDNSGGGNGRSNSAPRQDGTTTDRSGSESESRDGKRPAEPDGGGRDSSSSNPSETAATPPEDDSSTQPADETEQAGDRPPTGSDTDRPEQDDEETTPPSNSPDDDIDSKAAPDNGPGSDNSSPSNHSRGESGGSTSHIPSDADQPTNGTTPQDSDAEDGQNSPRSSGGTDRRDPGGEPDEEPSVPTGNPNPSSSDGARTRPGEKSPGSDDRSEGGQDDSASNESDRPSDDSGRTSDTDSQRARDYGGAEGRRSPTDPTASGDNGADRPEDPSKTDDTDTPQALPSRGDGNEGYATDPSTPPDERTGPPKGAGDGPDNGADAPAQSEEASAGHDNDLTPTQLPSPPTPGRSSPGTEHTATPDNSAETQPSGEPTPPERRPVNPPETPSPEPSGSDHDESTKSTEPPYDIDTGAGIVPSSEASASSDPTIVDVDEHVLNELTHQAIATPNREVYSTIYQDEDGIVRHWHPVEHPDFLETRKNSIKFTSNFFDHLRNLSRLRKQDIDHRLAGGVHSHPNTGKPRQSPADKRFARRVWRNQRNTMFIIGVNEGDGPDEWTISDDGKEVSRQSNEYVVRIRAFSGENDSKKIRLHQDMGQ